MLKQFVCVHWYGGANAQSFINYVKKVHELFNKPIWITEFAPADRNASSVEKSGTTSPVFCKNYRSCTWEFSFTIR